MTFKRDRIRPGIAGASQTPVDLTEAYKLENVLLDRDGVFRPRWGTETAYSSPGALIVNHVSNHPARDDIIMFTLDSGALFYYDVNAETATQITGVALADLIYPAPGTGFGSDISGGSSTAPQLYWMVWEVQVRNTPVSEMWYVDRQLDIASVSNSPASGFYLANHGRMTLSTDGESIAFSDASDSLEWTNQEVNAPVGCGRVVAVVPFADGISLILGTQGFGMVRGATESDVVVEFMESVPCNDNPVCVTRTGNGVAWLAPGPRIILYNGATTNIGFPLEEEIRDIGRNSDLWYDRDTNCLMLYADLDSEHKVYRFDLDRMRWLGSWWDERTHGVAYGPSNQLGERAAFYGQDDLMRASPDLYDDDGSPFTLRIESKPENMGMPEALKQTKGVWVDCAGEWTVSLQVREHARGAWSTPTGCSVARTDPGWVYFPVTAVWRERKLVFTAESADGVHFRRAEVDERVIALR